VSCIRNPFNISVVIPGELAVASATRNPGISKTSGSRPSAKSQDMLSPAGRRRGDLTHFNSRIVGRNSNHALKRRK
jgi:hypothetical protein